MRLDERSRAADSLASVLAVYDGFCNLKQVRSFAPRSQIKSYREKKNRPLYTSLCFFSLAVPLGFVRCCWPFKALVFSPGFRFQRCSPCMKIWSSPAARQILSLFRSLHLRRIARAVATLFTGWSCFSLFFFLQRLQVSGTLFFF